MIPIVTALVSPACRPAAPDGLVGPGRNVSDGTVSVTLAWDAPDRDATGAPLDDLASFRIYFGGQSPLVASRDTFVDVGLVTQYTLLGLEPGTYFFATTAIDESGNESDLSVEIAAELELP